MRDSLSDNRGTVASLLLVGILIALALGSSYARNGTGFAERTVWDWMELLILPIALTLAALLLNRAEGRPEREIAAQRDKTEREIAAQRDKTEREIVRDRLREAALQTYLDRMSELMLSTGLGLSGGKPSPDQKAARIVARARTLTVLHELDGTRKGMVLRFLHDSDLIVTNEGNSQAVIDLRGADLREADLSGADQSWSDLRKTNLQEAVLSRADLRGADLSGADLRGAVLGGSDLSGADLRGANLSGAILPGAILSGADLSGAFLSGADVRGVDLSWSNLNRASISVEQLAPAKSIKGATMPDGKKHE